MQHRGVLLIVCVCVGRCRRRPARTLMSEFVYLCARVSLAHLDAALDSRALSLRIVRSQKTMEIVWPIIPVHGAQTVHCPPDDGQPCARTTPTTSTLTTPQYVCSLFLKLCDADHSVGVMMMALSNAGRARPTPTTTTIDAHGSYFKKSAHTASR